MGNVGAWEIALIVLVILLIFGPKRLPQMGRSLGRGMREFKDSVGGTAQEIKEATADTPKQFKDALNPMKPVEVDDKPAEAAPVASAEAAPVPAEPAPAPPPPAAEAPVAEVVAEETVEPAAATAGEGDKTS
jgi:sec-independent protein translocase protein TatA